MAFKQNTTSTMRQEQAAETRQNLLDTAKKLFAQNGYSSTSVRSINKQLNMSDGILYHYFPDGKKEILSVILSEGIQKSLSFMKQFNEDLETMPLYDALDKIYAEGDMLFTDDLDLIKILLKESDNLELNETKLLSEVIQERISWFSGFLARRFQHGEIKEMNFDIASQQFLSISINNVVAKVLKIELIGKLDITADRRQIIEHTLSLWKNP